MACSVIISGDMLATEAATATQTVHGHFHLPAGRVWDLRTGKSIMTLQGHVKGIMSLDFSPNGFLLASGSEDHAARLWDLRKRKCIYTLPCHSSLVSQVGALAVLHPTPQWRAACTLHS